MLVVADTSSCRLTTTQQRLHSCLVPLWWLLARREHQASPILTCLAGDMSGAFLWATRLAASWLRLVVNTLSK